MSNYNGWTNKETWLIHIYFGGMFESMAADGIDVTPELIEQFLMEELLPDTTSPSEGLAIDFLVDSIKEANLIELANTYMEA